MNGEAEPMDRPTKADPSKLVLRGRPRRAIRFRRSVVIGGAATGTILVAAFAWLALQPAGRTGLAETAPQVAPDRERAPEALAGAPKGYGDVPLLGPPLPGDLGRPILERQREHDLAPPPMATGGPAVSPDGAGDARSRAAAERDAARQSPILVQHRAPAAPIAAPAPPADAGPSAASPVAPDPERGPAGQTRKQAFVATRDEEGDVNPHPLMPPASPFMLSAGNVIAASLLTGLDSDLPGLVTAQVTQNIYDSPTGHILLIPQGSRLVGRYDSVVAFGQQRALLIWQRIIFPDGSSVRIDNWPATDAAGYTGLADKLDLHTWQLLKGVALSTLLGVGTELGFSGDSDLVQALRQSTQLSTSRAGDQLVNRNLNVQQTIRVRPGWPLRVIVHRDLVLQPWHLERTSRWN